MVSPLSVGGLTVGTACGAAIEMGIVVGIRPVDCVAAICGERGCNSWRPTMLPIAMVDIVSTRSGTGLPGPVLGPGYWAATMRHHGGGRSCL